MDVLLLPLSILLNLRGSSLTRWCGTFLKEVSLFDSCIRGLASEFYSEILQGSLNQEFSYPMVGNEERWLIAIVSRKN